MSKHLVLLVDDDAEFCRNLSTLLEQQGFTVTIRHTAQEALPELQQSFDYLLFDWNLPDRSGIEICRSYRTTGGDAPVLFITGRGDTLDKEAAFGAGADDYICKPFDARELVSRMTAVRRRKRIMPVDKLRLRDVEFDSHAAMVSKSDRRAKLSSTEAHILELLLRNPNVLFSAERIATSFDEEVSEDAIRQRMLALRKKLNAIDASDMLETVPKGGYIIRSTDTTST